MRVLDRLDEVGVRRRLAATTRACYRHWVKRFLVYSRRGGAWRHPSALFAADVGAFLPRLARECRLSASSQNPAAIAIGGGKTSLFPALSVAGGRGRGGFELHGVTFKSKGLGFEPKGLRFELSTLRFKLQTPGVKPYGLGFELQGLGFKPQGRRFELQPLGFKPETLGFKR